MWRRAKGEWVERLRRSYSSRSIIRPPIMLEDEGDWFYSPEWWGNASPGHTVFRSTSNCGNGVVSVVAHPCSMPEIIHWPTTEKWLNQRYASLHPNNDSLKLRGYQWCSLRFNDHTRQSTVKIMGASMESDPASVYYMQQPHCLPVPYLKSMVSVGLTSLAAANFDLLNAVNGKKSMRILCIGHGGGSLPLFLASKIQGALVDVVEIDPLVIMASVQAMGFPAFSVMNKSGKRTLSKPSLMDEVMWKGVHERLFLYEADAKDFILKTSNIYDMVFIDAYDGQDIFPHKLWDPKSAFLKSLNERLAPDHGTVIVNLHADEDILNADNSKPSFYEHILPMGRYVSGVCRAYKDVLLQTGQKGSGLGFTVSVPWLCNASLVVCRGSSCAMSGGKLTRNHRVLSSLVTKSRDVDKYLNLPFSCSPYLQSGFVLVD